MRMRHLPLLFHAEVVLCLVSTMNAQAADHLNPDRPVNVKFTVASRDTETDVFAAVTFQSDGLQMVARGGQVAVNGIPLVAAALKKQGFWYNARVPKSARYQLEYKLAPDRAAVQRLIPDRPFLPALPEVVSRGSGLVVVFDGAPLMAGESIFAELVGGGEGPGRWGQLLRTKTEGNKIIVNAASLVNARLGQASLYVGLVVRDATPTGDYVSMHTNGSERMVNVTD